MSSYNGFSSFSFLDNYDWGNSFNFNFGNNNNFSWGNNFSWMSNYDLNDYNGSNNYSGFNNLSIYNQNTKYVLDNYNFNPGSFGEREINYTEIMGKNQSFNLSLDNMQSIQTTNLFNFEQFDWMKYNMEHPGEIQMGSQESLASFEFNESGERLKGINLESMGELREVLKEYRVILNPETGEGDIRYGKLGDYLFTLMNKNGKLVKVNFSYIACEFLSNINCIKLALEEGGINPDSLSLEKCVRAFIDGQGKGEDTIRYGSCLGDRQKFADAMLKANGISGRIVVNSYSNYDKYATKYIPHMNPYTFMEQNNINFNFALIRNNTLGIWGHSAYILNVRGLWYQIDSNTYSARWYITTPNTVVTYEYDPN